MLNVGLIRTLINDGRVKEIKEQMEKQQDLGMQTFDMALFNMVKEGTLKEDVALSYSENHSGLKLRFAQTDKNLALNSVKPKSSF
jgi:twitching motility protein PilU